MTEVRGRPYIFAPTVLAILSLLYCYTAAAEEIFFVPEPSETGPGQGH